MPLLTGTTGVPDVESMSEKAEVAMEFENDIS